MTALTWDAVGERFYELGIDRGVLYVTGSAGVPWSGLTSVDETSSGGEAKAYYLDALKFASVSSAEEYEATLSAYTYPEEFSACDGSIQIDNGLFATRQPRRSFGFSYRSMIGNDTEGNDLGYKINIVYNALVAPSSKSNATLNSSAPSPTNFSWPITARPVVISGIKPTAHFMIDSRFTPEELLTDIEEILYGTPALEPALPTPQSLYDLFTEYSAP